jgi:hypothetical protein
LKKFVASASCDCVYGRSVWRIRFWTSPSDVTMMSRTRFSDSARNSMCRKLASRRLVIHARRSVSCEEPGGRVIGAAAGRP